MENQVKKNSKRIVSHRVAAFIGSAWLLTAFGCLAAAPEVPSLTLQQAHETALRNHPRISVAELTALASRQVEREARAGFFPQVSANMVAVGTANRNTRLEAVGALNNPNVFERGAGGLLVSQLITDFGRTANLSQSANLRARAAENTVQATREQILLAVDGAYYSALQARAITRVAQQTVTNRQVLLDYVSTMASNKLKSELDVSFARVNLEDSQLLLSRALNDLHASYAQLANLMGQTEEPTSYHLVEETVPAAASTNVAGFVQEALSKRPDLLSLRNEQMAFEKQARAERAARYPVVAAVGAAGGSPVHDADLPDAYAAGGVTVTVPLYAGGLYAARQKEAELRAQAAGQNLRDLEDNVIRDVRIAWLNAQNAFDRLQIAQKLLANSREAFELAEARYKNSLSSMVELNQAELNEIAAEISYANTQYEYLLQRSTLSYQTGTLR